MAALTPCCKDDICVGEPILTKPINARANREILKPKLTDSANCLVDRLLHYKANQDFTPPSLRVEPLKLPHLVLPKNSAGQTRTLGVERGYVDPDFIVGVDFGKRKRNGTYVRNRGHEPLRSRRRTHWRTENWTSPAAARRQGL